MNHSFESKRQAIPVLDLPTMSGFTLQAMNPSNEQTLDLGIGGMTSA